MAPLFRDATAEFAAALLAPQTLAAICSAAVLLFGMAVSWNNWRNTIDVVLRYELSLCFDFLNRARQSRGTQSKIQSALVRVHRQVRSTHYTGVFLIVITALGCVYIVMNLTAEGRPLTANAWVLSIPIAYSLSSIGFSYWTKRRIEDYYVEGETSQAELQSVALDIPQEELQGIRSGVRKLAPKRLGARLASGLDAFVARAAYLQRAAAASLGRTIQAENSAGGLYSAIVDFIVDDLHDAEVKREERLSLSPDRVVQSKLSKWHEGTCAQRSISPDDISARDLILLLTVGSADAPVELSDVAGFQFDALYAEIERAHKVVGHCERRWARRNMSYQSCACKFVVQGTQQKISVQAIKVFDDQKSQVLALSARNWSRVRGMLGSKTGNGKVRPAETFTDGVQLSKLTPWCWRPLGRWPWSGVNVVLLKPTRGKSLRRE